MCKLGIAIFSFNRPNYLQKVLNSLKNNDLTNADLWFWQDGSVNMYSKKRYVDNDIIHQCIKQFEQTFPQTQYSIKWKTPPEWNVGPGIKQYLAGKKMFERYDRVLFLEDDMIISNDYVRLIQILLDQFASDRQVGTVQCAYKDYFHPTKENLHKVRKGWQGGVHFWGYATWKDRWLDMEKWFVENYYPFIKDIDYRDRPINQIREMYKRRGIVEDVSSQDAAKKWGFHQQHPIRIVTGVRRAKYIGEKGLHETPDQFKKSEYGKVGSIVNIPEYERWIREFKEIIKV